MASPPKKASKTAALSARVVALQLLHTVLTKGQTVEDALATHPQLGLLSASDSAFVRVLLMATLRHKGQAMLVVERFVERALAPSLHHVHHALLMGVVQIIWLETPPHAGVSETVEAVRGLRLEAFTGLVNATLKRIAKEKDALREELDARATRNFPDWLYEIWHEAYGLEVMRDIAQTALVIPPLDLNFKDAQTAKNWASLHGAQYLWGNAVRLENAGAVEQLPGFASGDWWVQDVAAQVPAMLLGDVAGQIVLDVCAAPGGKTAQLVTAGAQVTALDISKNRMKRLEENLTRLNVSAQMVIDDATTYTSRQRFDAVLLDAPCSATGTLRRHPELLWQRQPQDVERLCALQQRLLACAQDWLKVGGRLVYAVCSLQPEEGKAQIDAFLAQHPAFVRDPIVAQEFEWLPSAWITPDGDFQSLPSQRLLAKGHDGFYAARLRFVGK